MFYPARWKKITVDQSKVLKNLLYRLFRFYWATQYFFFSKYWWYQILQFTRLLESIKWDMYIQNQLMIIFIFTIYQNSILALRELNIIELNLKYLKVLHVPAEFPVVPDIFDLVVPHVFPQKTQKSWHTCLRNLWPIQKKLKDNNNFNESLKLIFRYMYIRNLPQVMVS